ncbi:MAG: hypothetical protein ISN29_07040, partial [Gammaproteobacteria bacterium AqS3]|nr:hypothetical protein [Gammaproteobacteria bacterium AqS3]
YSKLTGMVDDYGLVETMEALVASPEYADMPDGLKVQVLKNLITKGVLEILCQSMTFEERGLTDEQDIRF